MLLSMVVLPRNQTKHRALRTKVIQPNQRQSKAGQRFAIVV